MNLILTMAGKYLRFSEQGYKFPKYLLPFGNTNILSEILGQFLKGGHFKNVYLIANESDEEYMCHVKKIMSFHKINPENLFLIPDTTGQAETAYVGINKVFMKQKMYEGSVVFHNIDTVLYERNVCKIKKSLNENTGYIDVFQSNNKEYSYVSEREGYVTAISEKKTISDFATSGLYGFSTASSFVINYNGEQFISEIYKKLIDRNVRIKVGPVYNEQNTIVLGTPDEYIANSNKLLK